MASGPKQPSRFLMMPNMYNNLAVDCKQSIVQQNTCEVLEKWHSLSLACKLEEEWQGFARAFLGHLLCLLLSVHLISSHPPAVDLIL